MPTFSDVFWIALACVATIVLIIIFLPAAPVWKCICGVSSVWALAIAAYYDRTGAVKTVLGYMIGFISHFAKYV